MEHLFEIMDIPRSGKQQRQEIRIGIRIGLAGQQGVCPVTEVFDNYQAFKEEIDRMKADLEGLLKRARELLPDASADHPSGINPDLHPEEMWAALSAISEEEDFVRAFNELHEEKRKSLAEHVLTRCNIFSGRAAYFSSHYDRDSSSIE